MSTRVLLLKDIVNPRNKHTRIIRKLSQDGGKKRSTTKTAGYDCNCSGDMVLRMPTVIATPLCCSWCAFTPFSFSFFIFLLLFNIIIIIVYKEREPVKMSWIPTWSLTANDQRCDVTRQLGKKVRVGYRGEKMIRDDYMITYMNQSTAMISPMSSNGRLTA